MLKIGAEALDYKREDTLTDVSESSDSGSRITDASSRRNSDSDSSRSSDDDHSGRSGMKWFVDVKKGSSSRKAPPDRYEQGGTFERKDM